jgi:DNA primase
MTKETRQNRPAPADQRDGTGSMRFSPDFLDEIRARLPVSEVVGRRVKLKRQGREWAGLSPFNKERTPSFFVNDQKGFYHDFSSGRHGDVFTFLMETEGLGFPEAVEQLAGMAGVPMPRSSPEEAAQSKKRATLGEALERAARFFEAELAAAGGAAARAYLDRRNVKPETRATFRMGYAPARRDALKSALLAAGLDEALLVEAGLLIKPDDGGPTYDRFRDRVMIPIHDARGHLVAFGGRALGDVQPKYLNSPETGLFHKGSLVFNFHRARPAAYDAGDVVVVEGYMDVISLWQAGLKNVVASMGTAFGEEQVALLWRLAPEPVISFDGDKAGVAAAYRAVERILPHLAAGASFNFAFLPDGLDPDEFVQARGRDAFVALLKGAMPLFDLVWKRETEAARIDTPERKAALEKRLTDLAAEIRDAQIAKHYLRSFRVKLADLFWEGRRHPGDEHLKDAPFQRSQLGIRREGHCYNIQLITLGLLVEYPARLDDKHEAVMAIAFDPKLEAFKNALYRLLVEAEEVSVALIYDKLGEGFYDQLEAVHGRAGHGQAAGWRLRQLFPIVRTSPPEPFVGRCLDHFIEMLHLYAAEDDLDYLRAQIGRPGADEDAIATRIVELRAEMHLMHERVQHREHEFAEEAKAMQRQFAQGSPWEGLAA